MFHSPVPLQGQPQLQHGLRLLNRRATLTHESLWAPAGAPARARLPRHRGCGLESPHTALPCPAALQTLLAHGLCT